MIDWLPSGLVSAFLLLSAASIPIEYDCTIYGCPNDLICVSAENGCFTVDEVEQILYENNDGQGYDYELDRQIRAIPNSIDFSAIDEDQLLPDLNLDFNDDGLGIEKTLQNEDEEIKELESEAAKEESTSVVVFLAQK